MEPSSGNECEATDRSRGSNEKLDTSSTDVEQDHEALKVEEETPLPPPNGGFNAWLQVAGAFCLFLNTWYVT